MEIRCLSCGQEIPDRDMGKCPSCGKPRDNSTKSYGAPVRPIIFPYRRRTPEGEAPLTWCNDVVLIRDYFTFWHGLDWESPGSGLEFLRLLITFYRGNHLERIRRVRADLNKR